MGNLTVKKCDALQGADKIVDHSDGDGRYLRIRPSGAKSWVLRVVVAGREIVRGIGAYAVYGAGGKGALTLAQARLAAAKRREQLLAGECAVVSAPLHTFARVADAYIAASWGRWKHPEVLGAAWRDTLAKYALPVIGDKLIADITITDVKTILDPIWHTKNETAHRVRNRVEIILDYAYLLQGIDKSNPARWKGGMQLIYHSRKPAEHFAAIDYRELPHIVGVLIGKQPRSVTASCLLWVIFSACRHAEARDARWVEVDTMAGTWTIPAERAKAGRAHVVPFSEGLRNILLASAGRGSDYIFDNGDGHGLSNVVLPKMLKRVAGDATVTVHGLRSSFRDWAAECTDYPREVVEQALAHSIGAVERAYRRSDLLEKRRALMADWSRYLLRK